ncbi:MAG: hypothetical protein M3Q75_12455, partial [Gemmatimonadota bacterium]|nr:hypothetical protein [Gemmatimonadota bacterium]
MAVDVQSAKAPPTVLARVEERQPLWQRIGKRVVGYGILIFFAMLFVAPFLIALSNSLKTRPQ